MSPVEGLPYLSDNLVTDNCSTGLLSSIRDELIEICGEDFVITDQESLYPYGKDETLDLHFSFDILVKPCTAEEIALVLKCCNNYNIPVTPRGGGSGVTGGALPVKRGVVLSLERMNKIISIHPVDGYVIAEAGVITADLCYEVEKIGLYFPVAPSSAAYSMIGGNVAENAGSINSCRYGSTAQYVLNLQVVLPTGEIIWTGANVSKNTSGLNLTQLFVGSEGILGIVTKVVYRLLKKPAHELSLLAAFESLEDACEAVKAIKESTVEPVAVELIDHHAISVTSAYLNEPLPMVKENNKAHLLILLQEHAEALLTHSMETTALLLERYCKENILIGTTSQEKEKLWKLRLNIGAALTSGNKKYRDIDIAVPVSGLHSYLLNVKKICLHYHLPVACFGHAMDGNLHTMLMMNGNIGEEQQKRLSMAANEIYAYALKNGGTISGEHGIGYLQKDFMQMQFSEEHLSLMKNIKKLLDPNTILNPGKVV
ncbi:MAG TPA: FAD-linked oxidase C-terminal domain-containing protein [Bacteroidia bacterium]|nr:FAD-linked oxidase C-terminal domain-containing protein [Bacteroidia bacterium]